MRDGHVLCEHALAESTFDRRRCELPARWYALAEGILSRALIVLFSLKI